MRLYRKLQPPNYTDTQHSQIVDILTRYKRFFYWLIIQRDYIRQHEYDDYFQHIQITIWRRYQEYDRTKSTLVQWLGMVAKSAIIKYYRSNSIDQNKTDYVEDHASWYDQADTFYSEDLIDSLHTAIEHLGQSDRAVVQLYLTGANMRDESRARGKDEDYYGRRLDKVKKWIRANYAQYFEGVTVTDSKPWKGWTGGHNNEKAGCKPIHMLSLEGGFIKRYPSIAEAMRDGFQSAALHRCLTKGGTHGGYRWIYEGETRKEILNWKNKRSAEHQDHAQPVEQWSLSGEYIQTFPTMAAAGRAGFAPGNIYKVIKGLCQHHKGYVWRHPISHFGIHSMAKKQAV